MYAFRRPRQCRSSCFCALTLSVSLVAVLSASLLLADESDQGFNVRLTGDKLEGNLSNEDATWVLSGNVQLEYGASRLTASSMRVSRAQGNLATVLAEGDPVHFEQTEPTEVTAHAKSILYKLAEQKLILEGEVELTQKGNVVRGSLIEYDLAQGQLSADSVGSDDSEQIEFVLESP